MLTLWLLCVSSWYLVGRSVLGPGGGHVLAVLGMAGSSTVTLLRSSSVSRYLSVVRTGTVSAPVAGVRVLGRAT